MRLLDEVDDALRVLCLQWAIAGSTKESSDTGMQREDREALMAVEWFGALPFQSTVSTAYVALTVTVVYLSTTELP